VTTVQAVVLIAVAIAGGLVVFVPDAVRATLVLGIYGLCLAFLFFALQAPDVALSEIVVATVAIPLMILLALAKIREHEKQGEESE
jgi:uncharacterized MnhB-related membrane protein